MIRENTFLCLFLSLCLDFACCLVLRIWKLFSADPNSSNAERKVILPGSFNPLHDGHLKLLEVATRYLLFLFYFFSFVLFL